ncbi:MAG: hypothetical protein ACR2JB_02710 [Bryobacteraceae bacterium]
MLDKRKFSAAFLAAALMAGTCLAQSEKSKDEPQKFYRLDFVVKEVADAKVINTRSYSTMISTGAHPGSIRTGNKVPFQTGPASNYDYLDVGVKVDCRSAREVDNQLWLWVTADVSNLAPGSAALSAGVPPLLRQNSWSSDLILPLRKPTVIFSSDDPTSTHKMQVELTATPIR